MSLKSIKLSFENLSTCNIWSLQVLEIKTFKKNGTSYISVEIDLSPDDTLYTLINEISSKYLGNGKYGLSNYKECRIYDGTMESQVIYKLKSNSPLISEDFSKFLTAIANPEVELNPLEINTKASIIKGEINLNGEKTPIKLISMQNPVTTLKHKFLCSNKKFKEISNKVLSLRTTIDVLILKDHIYMFNISGEKLFNMERAYKGICDSKINHIKESDIVTDIESFTSIAKSGHNPRKFLSFSDKNLNFLKDVNNRKNIANLFKVELIEGKFNTRKKEDVDKIIKILCQKGMLDPFDNSAMEVSSSKKWY